jgi:hypothetical protein
MDSQCLWIIKEDDTFKLIDHRPSLPDMTLATAGTEQELYPIALRIVTGIGWEMVPVYVRDGFNCWKNINTN